MGLCKEVSITVIVLFLIGGMIVFTSKYAHGMESAEALAQEDRSSITVDMHNDPEEDLTYFRDILCEYAIKELMEKIHTEETSKVSQQRQKWVAIGVGTVTTILPLIVAIIQATTCYTSSPSFNTTT